MENVRYRFFLFQRIVKESIDVHERPRYDSQRTREIFVSSTTFVIYRYTFITVTYATPS